MPLISDGSPDPLVDRIRERRLDPNTRTSMSKSGYDIPPLCPPVSLDVVGAVERRQGFPLPPLLRTLYTEIGNGGFGPGYGLWGIGTDRDYDRITLDPPWIGPGLLAGVAGEWLRNSLRNSISANPTFASTTGQPQDDFEAGRVVTVCDWGCANWSSIDCSTEEGEMIFSHDRPEICDEIREGISFRQWMQDWADVVDLWTRVYPA